MKNLIKTRFLGLFVLALAFNMTGLVGGADAQPANRNLDIYLLIGQSNMGGRGEITPQYAGAIPGVYVLRGANDWAEGKSPMNVYSTVQGGSINKMNPGYGFATKMRGFLPNKQIGIVSNARGASGLDSWMPGTRHYREAVARARLAMEYGTIKGVLWHQGEEDSKKRDPNHIRTYLSRITVMINSLRDDLGNPTLPFIAGQIFQKPGNYAEFNQMILGFPGILPNTELVSSRGITARSDNVHFDTAGQKLLGERYADKMIDLYSPDDYVFAANENQAVDVTGTVNIAYGANGKYNYLFNQTSNVQCNNATFGDPIPGVGKKCFVQAVGANCAIVPHLNINNEGWNSVSTASVEAGDEVWFGPQSQEFGTSGGAWSYTGPNSQSHSGRSWVISNIQANQAGTYTVTDVDQNGCSATHDFTISINGGGGTPTGAYFIKNVSTGRVLDANPDGVIVMGTQGNTNDRRWNIFESSGGYVMIDNGMADRGPIRATTSTGKPLVWLAESFNTTPFLNREWLPVQVSGNIYKFQSRDSARGYLGVSNGNPVNQADGNATTAQWELISTSISQ